MAGRAPKKIQKKVSTLRLLFLILINGCCTKLLNRDLNLENTVILLELARVVATTSS